MVSAACLLQIAPDAPHISSIRCTKALEAPALFRQDQYVGGELEHNEAEQQGDGLGEKHAAQKQEEIGEVHGVAGEAVDAGLTDAALRRGGKGGHGQQEQGQPRRIQPSPGPKAWERSKLEPGEQKEKQNGRGGELIEPIGRPLPPLHGREVGGALHAAPVQGGEHAKADEKKGNQKQRAHGHPSLHVMRQPNFITDFQAGKDSEKTARKITEYFRTPFNEPLDRLIAAGETDMLPLNAVIHALHLPGVDLRVAELLSVKFDYIYRLYAASPEEIHQIEGITPEQAEAIHHDLQRKEKIIRKLNTLSIYRLQEKSVDNLINGIQQSKQRDLPAFLYALGIRYIGETASRNLARHFKDIRAIEQASFEQLTEVEDIGEQMAQSLVHYFSQPVNREMLDRFLAHGISGRLQEEEGSSYQLAGQTFVITGTLSRPREHFKTLILKAGGKVSDAVSGKTTYLLAGENAGSKLQKAQKLNIPILNEESFEKLIKQE